MKTTCIVSNAFPFIALLYWNFREMSSNFYVKNIQILPLYFMQFFRFLAIFCRIIKTTADNKFCHPLSFFMMQNLLITLPQVDYVLGEYEGYLAVFRGEQQKPYQVLQMPVQLLPEEDQGAIEAGIHVQTEQELRRLLEDFAS